MNTQILYHVALVAHITGLTLMAGITLADFIMTQQFWKQFALDKVKGATVLNSLSRFPMLLGIGILLLIISGVGMMAITHGVFGEQVWFRIKFALVLVLIINGVAIGRRQGMKVRNIVTAEIPAADNEAALLKLKSNINLFHAVQLTLFFIVFTLSVFKFN